MKKMDLYKKYMSTCHKFWVIVFSFLAFEFSVFSQSQIVEIQGSRLTIKEIFRQIERQTGLSVDYNSFEIDDSEIVTSIPKKDNVSNLLAAILDDASYSFSFHEKHIIITRKKPGETLKTIKGTIVDEQGQPLTGVYILEQDSSDNGTTSDMNGNFSLKVSDRSVIEVSYLGYISQSIKIGNKTDLTIQLQIDNQLLDEIVVVGYGTQKKINLTGSVEVLDGDKLENRAVSTVTQALQGQISGANFSIGDNGYEPGASPSFQIRGQGSAYILVDGVPTALGRVNPNDIESISVLKDAAAASIYGALASYGVVLITTKSGKKNMKPVVSFNSNVSFVKLQRKPRMVDSHTFARMLNEAGDNGGGRVYDNETIDRIIAYQQDPTLPETVPSTTNPGKWAEEQYSNANYDWFEEFYGTGINNQENISIRGGGEKASYYLSAGHVYDGGILNYGTDTYRRINTLAKIDARLTDWWTFSVNNRFQKSKRVKPNFDNQGDYDLLFHQIARTFPNQAKVTPNGYYTRLSKIPWTQDAGTDETVGYEFMQRFATEIKPLKGWSINLDYTFRLYNSKFTSNNFIVYEDLVDGTLIPMGTTAPSYVQKNQSSNFYSSFNAYTTYEFNFSGNNFSIMAGIQQEQQRNEQIAGRKNDLVTDDVPSFSTSTGDIISLTDALTHWARFGSFFRLGYNYKERYLLEINARYDGTSVFAEGHRWGLFPSVSAGWNISKESFFESASETVNNLKLRLSWGTLGNQDVSAYQDLALIGINSNLGWLLNGSRPVYTVAPNLVNHDLTWEKSETFDIGIDISMLDNRLEFVADWYNRYTKNRLGPADVLPAVIGADIPQKNNSELKTNGWEVSLGWRDSISGDFSYSASFMLFDYYSIVTKYNNPTKLLSNNYEGKMVGTIWGYTTEGIIQSEEEAQQIMDSNYQKIFHSTWSKGDIRYKDINGDGIIDNGKNTLDDHGDLSIIGNSSPRFQFAFSMGLNWKGLDFSMLWQGVGKRDLWIDSNMFWGFNTWNQTSLFIDEHLDYYRDKDADTYSGLGVNTDSYFPKPYLVAASNNKNRKTQTRFLQNGAFARLKNLQIGYSLPKRLTDKLSLSRLRIYFSGDNLLLFTGKFPKSLDPETAKVGKRGDAKSMNPQSIYAFGVEIEF